MLYRMITPTIADTRQIYGGRENIMHRPKVTTMGGTQLRDALNALFIIQKEIYKF